jgi:hypothetical protein
MPYLNHVIQLIHLVYEWLNVLQVALFYALSYVLRQFPIGSRVHDHVLEQVLSYAFEQRQVVSEELRQIDLIDTSEDKHAFTFILLVLFKVLCRSEHGLDCSHSVIIMILVRQLF